MIIVEKQDINYTQVSNEILKDKKLSVGSRFTFTFISSLDPIETYTAKDMAHEIGISFNSFNKYIKELKDAGYMYIYKRSVSEYNYILGSKWYINGIKIDRHDISYGSDEYYDGMLEEALY